MYDGAIILNVCQYTSKTVRVHMREGVQIRISLSKHYSLKHLSACLDFRAKFDKKKKEKRKN